MALVPMTFSIVCPPPIATRSIVLFALIGCGCAADDRLGEAVHEPRLAELHPAMQDEDLLYGVQRVLDGDGTVVEWVEIGEWTEELRQRAARPWHYLDEELGYESVAWYDEREDGHTVAGYAVTARAIGPAPPPITPEATGIDAALAELIDTIESDELIPVMIAVSRDPAPPLPLLPNAAEVSAETYVGALAARQAIADGYDAAFHEGTASLDTAIEAAGGVVEASFWEIRWISAVVPAASVAALAERPDVLRIRATGTSEDGACEESGPETHGDAVSLGQLRDFTGVQDYLDLGYHGQPSAGQEVLLGIHESYGLAEDACFQADYGDCDVSDRMRGLFACADGSCAAGDSGPPNGSVGYEHGTIVASIALGDYTQNQGVLNEQDIAPGLGAGWRDDASGMGKEVEGHYYSGSGQETGSIAAFQCARGFPSAVCTEPVDIVTSSNALGLGVCNAASQLPVEATVEQLVDDGVLPVILTHNDNHYYEGPDLCLVRSPADLPVALAVGALQPSFSAAYSTWGYAGYSNRGGGPSTVGTQTYPSGMSIVDLVASGFPGYVTTDENTYGRVEPDGPCGGICLFGGPCKKAGTSFATPAVAGASALVQHRYLAQGLSWIDDPGRLLAVMLSMGDRATWTVANGATDPTCVSSGRIRCGADRYFGMGRLKLRFHNMHQQMTHVWNTASPTSATYMLFGGASVDGGTRNNVIVKCVLQQREEMANKTDISSIGLQLRLRTTNASSQCVAGQGTVIHTVIDSLPDDKHMVTILDSQHDFNRRCAEVSMLKNAISSSGVVVTDLYCYADEDLDY